MSLLDSLSIIEESICTYCYPNHYEELRALSGLFHKKNGSWIGGYSKEKGEKYEIIRERYEKDKKVPCVMIESDYGVYICKKCLLKVIERM